MTDDELYDQERYEEWAEREAHARSVVADLRAGIITVDPTTEIRLWEEEQAAWWDDGCPDVRFA